jgi:hypothetical protein
MALCVLFFVIKCQAKTKRVLFIGNSLTYYNNMVDVLKEMIKEQGADIAIYNITPGGATLSNHIKSSSNIDLSGSKLTGGITATRQKILSEHWDFIILQEATLMCLIPEEREYSCKPAIKILNQTIKTVKARTVLYQLFALSEYPVKYCHPPAVLAINEIISLPQNRMKSQYCSDSFSNSREEFNVIETFYKNISKEINADGVIFVFLLQVIPQLALHFNYLSVNKGDTLLCNTVDNTNIFIHNENKISFHLDDIAHVIKYQSFSTARKVAANTTYDNYNHSVVTLKNGTRIVITSLMDGGVFNFPIPAEKIEVRRNLYRWAKGPSLTFPQSQLV